MKTLIEQIKDIFGTDAKAAIAFGVSPRTFQRWKRKGDFPRGIYREKAVQLKHMSMTPAAVPAE